VAGPSICPLLRPSTSSSHDAASALALPPWGRGETISQERTEGDFKKVDLASSAATSRRMRRAPKRPLTPLAGEEEGAPEDCNGSERFLLTRPLSGAPTRPPNHHYTSASVMLFASPLPTTCNGTFRLSLRPPGSVAFASHMFCSFVATFAKPQHG